MNHILEVEELEIMNDKLREKSYKECLLKCDNRVKNNKNYLFTPTTKSI